jgi:hypothetical protein
LRNSARPGAVLRRVHIDNAAAHTMFLIPAGNRARDHEHEGVNPRKNAAQSRQRAWTKIGARRRPIPACGPRFYQLVATRRRAYTMML